MSYLFRGLDMSDMPPSPPSSSTSSQTRAWRKEQQTLAALTIPWILAIWKHSSAEQGGFNASSNDSIVQILTDGAIRQSQVLQPPNGADSVLVGSFLFEQLAYDGTARKYVIGGATSDAPNHKKCVCIEASDNQYVLNQLQYRTNCSRERRMRRGAHGSVAMLLGALSAAMKLESENQDKDTSTSPLAKTLRLTDDSKLEDVTYPDGTPTHQSISMADYMLIKHGNTWYQKELGVQLAPEDAVKGNRRILKLVNRAQEPMSFRFEKLWNDVLEPSLEDDEYYSSRLSTVKDEMHELYIRCADTDSSNGSTSLPQPTWRQWIGALSNHDKAILVVCWNEIMGKMRSISVGTLDWVVDIKHVRQVVFKSGLRMTLVRADAAIQVQAAQGGGKRSIWCKKDIDRLYVRWQKTKTDFRNSYFGAR